MNYLFLTIEFIFFCLGSSSLWVYLTWGRPSVRQVFENLINVSYSSPLVFADFLTYVIIPSVFLCFFPKKIKIWILILSLCAPIYVFNLYSYIKDRSVYSTLYEDEFITVDTNDITSNGSTKNLVVIYVESLEKQYGNAKYSDNALTPYLQSQKKNNLHFNGYEQLAYTKYTLASIMGTQCGFYASFYDNSLNNQPFFFSQIHCIPDILYKKGYNNFFYKSANIEFANTFFYATQHHFQTVKGWGEWQKEYPNSKSIKGNSWGARDSFLYQQIKNTILEMTQKKQLFSIFATTVDTHGEADFIDPICNLQNKSKENMIKCADYLLEDFIEWCKKQPFYKDLVIVVLGDHTAHGLKNDIYKVQPQKRQIENIIFNASRTDMKKHQWTTFDLAPTIMEAIGYNLPALGLGKSLFHFEQTLFEKYGKKFEIMLNQNSLFLDNMSHTQTSETQNKTNNYYKINIGEIYQGENKLKTMLPYSNLARFSLGYLWLKNINLDISATSDLILEINAIAITQNKKRLFKVYANGKNIGEILFDIDKNAPQTFYIKIPKNIAQKRKITLDFVNSDINHWNITSLGIGIDRLSVITN